MFCPALGQQVPILQRRQLRLREGHTLPPLVSERLGFLLWHLLSSCILPPLCPPNLAVGWGGTDRVTWRSVQQEEARQCADGCCLWG